MLWFKRKTLSGSHSRKRRGRLECRSHDLLEQSGGAGTAVAQRDLAPVGGEDEGSQQAVDDQGKELRLRVVRHYRTTWITVSTADS